jgi:hypothetical protein
MLHLPGRQDVDGELGHLHFVVQLEDAVEVVGAPEPVLLAIIILDHVKLSRDTCMVLRDDLERRLCIN